MNTIDPASCIRVAIADDHSLVRAGMRRFIASFADLHFAGQAGSAEEALTLAQGGGIDVLLLDVNMSGRSGLQILPLLRQIAPRMQVLVVSAQPTAAAEGPALRAGAFAYLEKPVHPRALERAIRSAAEAAEAAGGAANDNRFGQRG